MIKVIAFDLDDTLWAVRPIIINAEARLNDWLKTAAPELIYDVVSMRELRHEVLAEQPELRNQISEFRRKIIEKALLNSSINKTDAVELSHQAMEIFLTARNEITFFEGALDALKLLSETYVLGALSNGNADIKRLGLDKYFSFAYSAEQVGAAKPAHDLFLKAIEHTGCPAQHMVYVGDDPLLDIDAANEAGLFTIQVHNPDKQTAGSSIADEQIEHISHLPDAMVRLTTRLRTTLADE